MSKRKLSHGLPVRGLHFLVWSLEHLADAAGPQQLAWIDFRV